MKKTKTRVKGLPPQVIDFTGKLAVMLAGADTKVFMASFAKLFPGEEPQKKYMSHEFSGDTLTLAYKGVTILKRSSPSPLVFRYEAAIYDKD